MTGNLQLLLLALGTLLLGCSGPSRIEAPAWNPSSSAAKALDLWDTDQDGGLDAQELRQCPGLARDMRAVDSDKDGKMSGAELLARLQAFEANGTGLKAASFLVTLNGKPLPAADVRLIPEKFMEGILEPAFGKTNTAGILRPQSESADLRAMQLGYYRVEIESALIKTDAQRESIRSLGASVEPFSYAKQTLAIKD
ncbi:MAG: hypothetical protein ACR2PZ_06500 [Pseudomonadales bacterium]